jgi:Tfp pilus assembly protein PilW
MTLVELMVAVGITMVIMALSIKFFQGQFASYYSGKETKKIQETNGDIGELLRRDLAAAGYGVTPQMAFYILDGGSGGSDTIYINDVSAVPQPTGQPTEMSLVASPCPAGDQFTSASNQMTLANYASNTSLYQGMFYSNDFTPADFPWVISDVTLSNAADVKVAKITSAPGPTGAIALNATLTGTNVAPAIAYYVSGNNLMRLDRSSGGPQIVAENVVDLQVAYQALNTSTSNPLTQSNWYGAAGCSGTGDQVSGKCSRVPLDLTLTLALRVTIVTRSEDKSGQLNSLQYCRPAVENRAGDPLGSASCGYIYRTYQFTVQPRNVVATPD